VKSVIVDICDNHVFAINAAQLGQSHAEVVHVAVLRNCHLVLGGTLVWVHKDQENLKQNFKKYNCNECSHWGLGIQTSLDKICSDSESLDGVSVSEYRDPRYHALH